MGADIELIQTLAQKLDFKIKHKLVKSGFDDAINMVCIIEEDLDLLVASI